MKGLINFFVSRHVTVIMIISAVIIAAIFSLINIPINRLPELTIPRVTIETQYPGMTAEEIRSMVTIPLEDGLSSIKGLERMRSVSRDNRSFISLDFRWGTDIISASILVREAVDAVYPGLPEGVKKPSVTSGDSDNEAHAVIAVSSRKLAEYEITARLRKIDGVGSVIIAGGEIIEEKLSLDVQRLAAIGITPSEFSRILAQETADIPAGNAREGNTELVVIGSGKPDSKTALSQIILPVKNGSLKVEDAGDLQSSVARRESVFVYNGKAATALEVYRRPGADPLRLSRDIKKTVDEAVSLFSRDAQIELITDSSPSLISGITSLIISAVLGAGAAVVVLLLFIRRLKHSLLAALSIPFSIAAGICILFITGKSLNSMSLSGLALGIGLVSDISVIVLDLLYRAFEKNKNILLCEIDPNEIGDKVFSIAGSSAASTLTTALVFVPILMLPGALGSLFGDLAIALVTSVAAGWFYAQFCLPSLYREGLRLSQQKSPNSANSVCVRFINFKIVKKIQSVFTDGSLVKKYSEFLTFLLRRSGKLFAVAALLSVVGFLTLITLPVVFINPDDVDEILVSIIFPSGTLLESIEKTSYKISLLLSGLPSVKTVYGRAGAEENDVGRRADIDYKKEEIILRCVLEKGIKAETALGEIKKILQQEKSSNEISGLYFGAGQDCEAEQYSVFFPKDKTEVLLGLSSANTFVIKGKDRKELNELTEFAKEEFDSKSISVNFRPRGQRPELRFFPNREASAFLSISAAQIAETLHILNEGVVAARLEIEGRPLDVRVTGKKDSVYNMNHSVSYLEQIPLRTSQGKTVFLGSLGRIERMEAEAALARLDRTDVIYADIVSVKEIPSSIKKIAVQADESVFSRYRNSLLLFIFLILILLYITMGAQFESFLLPVILMMTIPFSLAGAGPALLIAGSKIDSGAVLGLTALFGLVVNNSLILYEICEQKIRSGLSPAFAVWRGACERLQAILITMATTIFALLPLILSPMGNSQKSMAAAMLGGLTVSTLLSLFVIPAILIRYFKWKILCGSVK
ncbi:MAG: efflux RND transporter permease subunit [Treponema sp.]|nr:efflux RND transporter permease subunit [Treponema sp.]MCL2250616.1 efflux RND transporter permease subunit [Treponema sp.]